MKNIRKQVICTLVLAALGAVFAAAQATPAPYQPKFPGDPAKSDSEAQALGYMRVVLRAQREYKKRHNKYAETLPDLAGTGSFTVGSSRVDLQACKLEYSIVSPK